MTDTVTQPPTQMQLAATAAKHVELSNVHLGALTAKCIVAHKLAADTMLGPGVEAKVGWSVTHNLHEVPAGLTVHALFKVELIGKGEAPASVLEIDADVVLTYSLDSLPPSDKREHILTAFAQINGVYNSWPYFRELVQNTCARMALPPVILPVYRVPRLNETKPVQEGLARKRA